MGPVFHFLGVSVGMITHDASFVFEPGYPTNDERLLNLRPVTPRRGLRRGHHVRHEQRVRVRLPARQHGPRARPAGPARAQLRDRRRGRQHPHRRGADAADHQRPGRGVGRPVLHVRPARAAAQGPARGRRRRAATTSSTSRTRPSPRPKRASRRWRAGSASRTCTTPTRASPATSSRRSRAHALYKRDRDYIVKDGEIIIVDEFTGRQMPGRRWSEGLHQAIEAKEGLRVQRESVTLATITFQNYFRLYDKLSGMTGTAMTEAEELHKIYKLEVVAIPTHREMVREDDAGPRLPRRAGQVQRAHRRDRRDDTRPGRPVLVGTVTVEKSEMLADDAQAPRHQARGPQRQVPREGIGDRRPGRSVRRGHHRDQHGRPRHGHPARRQPGRSRLRDRSTSAASTRPRWTRRR